MLTNKHEYINYKIINRNIKKKEGIGLKMFTIEILQKNQQIIASKICKYSVLSGDCWKYSNIRGRPRGRNKHFSFEKKIQYFSWTIEDLQANNPSWHWKLKWTKNENICHVKKYSFNSSDNILIYSLKLFKLELLDI